MPEFLKHFIVANSAVLFALLLISASIGLWTIGRHVRALVGRRRKVEDQDPLQAAGPTAALVDALDAAHERIDRLEALVRFDRELDPPQRRDLLGG